MSDAMFIRYVGNISQAMPDSMILYAHAMARARDIVATPTVTKIATAKLEGSTVKAKPNTTLCNAWRDVHIRVFLSWIEHWYLLQCWPDVHTIWSWGCCTAKDEMWEAGNCFKRCQQCVIHNVNINVNAIRRSWRSRWTHVLMKIWNNSDTARSTEFENLLRCNTGGKDYDVYKSRSASTVMT